MEDKEIIERLEEIIETLKSGEREQAECDLSDLYEEIQSEYDEYEDEEESDDSDSDYEEDDSEDWDEDEDE
jgi:hypothetical protein